MKRTARTQKIHPGSKQHILVTLGLWFAFGSWGGAYVAARFLLHPAGAGFVSLSPLVLAASRFSIASLFFLFPLAQAIVRRQVSARDLLLMALLGQLTFSLYYWLQYIGIQHTNARVSCILGVGLIPIFTTLLAQLFGQERRNVLTFGILLLGFVGVAFLVFQQPFDMTLHSGFLLGAFCLISNTFFFAIYSILGKRWMQNISPIVLTGGTMISGTLGLLIISLLDPANNHWSDVAKLALPQWIALVFLALMCSVFAYFAYNVALSTRDASRVTVYFYVEPIIAVVLGIFLLGEHLTWQILVGGVAIISAMILSNKGAT